MSYELIAIPNFKREIKKLAKKYPSLKNDFAQLLESLQEEPAQGTPLGNNCYKIRMAISSKGKGKSGGSRVITPESFPNDRIPALHLRQIRSGKYL